MQRQGVCLGFLCRRGGSLGLVCLFFLLSCIPVPRVSRTESKKSVRQNSSIAGALVISGAPRLLERSQREVDLEAPLQAGWPLVVDFRLERAGVLLIEIAGERPGEEILLKLEGKAQKRKVQKRNLPRKTGKALRNGAISVRAQTQSGEPVGFDLFAIGAGKKSVASVAIQDLRFSPTPVSRARAVPIKYEFRSKADFDSAGVRVLRRGQQGGVVRWQGIRDLDLRCKPLRGKTCRGTWDGLDDQRTLSTGLHALEVMAVIGHARAEDWVLAVSPDLVEVTP